MMMALRCVLCAHMPPGDKDIARATMAVTVMSGMAVCEDHIDWLSLPPDIEEMLLAEKDTA